MRNGNLLKMRVSQIRVNQIRVNQGLGVIKIGLFCELLSSINNLILNQSFGGHEISKTLVRYIKVFFINFFLNIDKKVAVSFHYFFFQKPITNFQNKPTLMNGQFIVLQTHFSNT